MKTKINISRKLESIVPKSLVNKKYLGLANPLGKWTATVFYVSRKKCLMITNSTAKYTVFIERITSSVFKDFSKLFTQRLYNQLLEDGIEIDYKMLENLVGEVELIETDNDRKIIGIQNSLNPNLEYWKEKYGHIDNWSFRHLNKIINGIPYKQIDYKSPREKMKEEIKLLNTNA